MNNVHRVGITEVLDELEDADVVTALLQLIMEGYELYGEERVVEDAWYGVTCVKPYIITAWRESWLWAAEELLDELEMMAP